MLLLRPSEGNAPELDVWTAETELSAEPDAVLRALTDPALIAEWAPVAFDVDGLASGQLEPGGCARVSGMIAGLRATFDIEVLRADTDAFELVAEGPVSFEVSYRFRPHCRGLVVDARVAVPRRRGIAAQLLRSATVALLNAGALGAALRRLDASVSCECERELVAA